MNLTDITPVILTHNEEPNIERCLQRLDWAHQIIVIDSHSTDATPEICRQNPRVTFLTRKFDTLAGQANYGLANAKTSWILSLDADYMLDEKFSAELESLPEDPNVNSYLARFIYCVFGKELRGTLYPPRKILYRRECARYIDDGHAHRVQVPGNEGYLSSFVKHDDRKSITRWFTSQIAYATRDADKLTVADVSSLRKVERLRRAIFFAPWMNLFWCLFVKGVAWDGPAGWYYAFQRVTAELMLSLCLLDRRLRKKTGNS